MKRYLPAFGILVLLFILAACASEDRRPGSLTGLILDGKTGEFVEGVQVNVEPRTTPAYTDSDGVYVLPNLPPGGYRLVADKPGFQDFSRQIRVSPAITLTNDIILQPLMIVVPTEAK